MNMQQIMAQAQKMEREVSKQKEEIEEMVFTGKSELCEVQFSGKREMLKCKITKCDDVEMLEDMVLIATNDALKKVANEYETKMGKFGKLGGLF